MEEASFHSPGRITRRRWLAPLLAFVLVASAGPAGAASKLDGVDQRLLFGEVIPKYLVGFGLNTGWPDTAFPAGADFRIGVLGRDPSDGALEKLVAGKSLKGHPIVIARSDDPAALAGCQIVFADRPAQETLDRLLAAVAAKPVLTVVFSPDRPVRGGMVELFLTKEGGVRYTLDIGALKQAGLAASPELLQLALRAPPR
jgi:hypothetical protein